ncbi:MAG: hypothetical protein WAQ27_04740 [Candidatus Microsaccharimonas sp.]
MNNPYIISQEFNLASSPQNSLIKQGELATVRESLDAELRAMGKETWWVSENSIANVMNKQANQSTLPTVSLDEVYLQSPDMRLGISRAVDTQFNDAGYAPRTQEYASITNQLNTVASLGSEIQLVDDVIFSGEMVAWLATELEKRDVRIKRVLSGIAIKEGMQKLESLGIDVDAAYMFDAVDDEICERDLFVAKGSGRRIAERSMNAFYFDTENGKPEQWASIPGQYTRAFFRNSLERSRNLLLPDVPMKDVGSFYGYPNVSNSTAIEVINQQLSKEELYV